MTQIDNGTTNKIIENPIVYPIPIFSAIIRMTSMEIRVKIPVISRTIPEYLFALYQISSLERVFGVLKP